MDEYPIKDACFEIEMEELDVWNVEDIEEGWDGLEIDEEMVKLLEAREEDRQQVDEKEYER